MDWQIWMGNWYQSTQLVDLNVVDVAGINSDIGCFVDAEDGALRKVCVKRMSLIWLMILYYEFYLSMWFFLILTLIHYFIGLL